MAVLLHRKGAISMFIDPEELIPSDGAAAQLDVQPQTLASWRTQGRGPDFVKVGRAVFYRKADIAAWLGQQRRQPKPATSREASPQ
jgi:hypothetical protein